jgi:hypothetical protein
MAAAKRYADLTPAGRPRPPARRYLVVCAACGLAREVEARSYPYRWRRCVVCGDYQTHRSALLPRDDSGRRPDA